MSTLHQLTFNFCNSIKKSIAAAGEGMLLLLLLQLGLLLVCAAEAMIPRGRLAVVLRLPLRPTALRRMLHMYRQGRCKLLSVV